MGSGRSGGGGGGGGGSGGGGGGRFPGYRVENGKLQTSSAGAAAVAGAVRTIMRKLPPEHLAAQFASPPVQAVYADLFAIRKALSDDKNWDPIEARFGVAPDAGCLRHLASTLMKEHAQHVDYRVRKHLQVALETFLMRATGDDPRSLFTYTGAQAVKKADAAVLDRTSNEFITELVFNVIMSEPDAIPVDAEYHVREVAAGIADRAIEAFEHRTPEGKNPSYSKVVKAIAEDSNWFIEALRE